MKEREVTIYQTNLEYHDYPRILKTTFKLDEKDKLIIEKDGYTQITLVDNYQNGHNGDWEDDHEYGHQTFKQAKQALLKQVKEDFKIILDKINALKENK